MPNIDWLLREAMDQRALKTSAHMVIDDASWRADIERLEIGGGLRVFLTDAQARRDVVIEARDDRSDQWMGSQVTLAGRADIDFCDGQKTIAAVDRALLFRPSNRRAAYGIKAGGRFHSAGYGLEVERIRRLFEEDVPEALQPLLATEVGVSRIREMPGERSMRHLARGLFARGFNGPLRILMIEGSVLQLLAVQCGVIARGSPRRSRRALSARERSAIGEARERLLADMCQPPTLGELAAAVGLTEKRLNAGFRTLFGATVFQLLHDERLEHGRLAIEQGVPLKEVASRVGYNHTNNFINAFTARYGAPPRKYLAGAEQSKAVSF